MVQAQMVHRQVEINTTFVCLYPNTKFSHFHYIYTKSSFYLFKVVNQIRIVLEYMLVSAVHAC